MTYRTSSSASEKSYQINFNIVTDSVLKGTVEAYWPHREGKNGHRTLVKLLLSIAISEVNNRIFVKTTKHSMS